jgi:sugar/nucleoside kinase (ribokinase family)
MPVSKVVQTCGGGACNTAVGLARLGCAAAFEGVVSSDQWGEQLLTTLQKEGVNTTAATIVEGETSSFSIILSSPSGERVILYDPAGNRHLHDAVFDRDMVATMDWVYLNHIHEQSCVIEDDLVNILGSDLRPGLTWNPGGAHIRSGLAQASNTALAARTTLMLLNKEEALDFTGKRTVTEAIHALLAAGVQNVCVTDGKRGVTASDGTTICTCPTLPVPVVDTTGAGDAFGTAATWALLQGMDLPNVLKAGTINASSVVGRIGAQAGLLTNTDMQRRLQEIALTVSSTPLSS